MSTFGKGFKSGKPIAKWLVIQWSGTWAHEIELLAELATDSHKKKKRLVAIATPTLMLKTVNLTNLSGCYGHGMGGMQARMGISTRKKKNWCGNTLAS